MCEIECLHVTSWLGNSHGSHIGAEAVYQNGRRFHGKRMHAEDLVLSSLNEGVVCIRLLTACMLSSMFILLSDHDSVHITALLTVLSSH